MDKKGSGNGLFYFVETAKGSKEFSQEGAEISPDSKSISCWDYLLGCCGTGKVENPVAKNLEKAKSQRNER